MTAFWEVVVCLDLVFSFRAVWYCGGCFEQDRGVLLSKPGSFVGVVTWVVCRSSGGSWRGCSS